MEGNSMNLYNNNDLQVIITLSGGATSYSETGSYVFYIGGNVANGGFVWYFVITNDSTFQSSLISTASTSNCLSPSCSPATSYAPGMIDPYVGTGFLSTDLHSNNDSQGTSCPSPTYSCYGSVSIVCSCSTGTCYFDTSSNTNTCWCYPGFVSTATTCSCPAGTFQVGNTCVNCYSACTTCNQADICLTCIANNASPNGSMGCTCNIRYYSTSSLTTSGACNACDSECASCNQALICLTCIASNAGPGTSQGCSCNDGYFASGALTTSSSCTACYVACSTCNQANICLTCIAANAYADDIQGCNCDNGYYGSNPLVTAAACLVCYSSCATCNEASVCLTCIAKYAYLDTLEGCDCDNGYYAGKPMTSVDACTNCYIECATCNQADLCITCIASNAVPSISQGCSCNEGYFGNSPLDNYNSCMKCNNQCSTCNNSDSCLACIDVNAFPNIITGIGCMCQAGYYQKNSVSCGVCPEACITCIDFDTCTSCRLLYSNPNTHGTCDCPVNAVSNSTSCYCSTGSTIYLDPSSLLYSCVACHPTCNNCTGTKSTQCISCSGLLKLNPSSNKCEVCPIGMYFTNNSCYDCSNDCTTCSSYEFCLTCSASNMIANSAGQCNIECGAGTVLVEGSCYNCVELCKVCADIDTCTTCTDNAFLLRGICSCSRGYTSSNNTCVTSYFSGSLQVILISAYNKLILSLTETPTTALSLSDFQITVQDSTPTVEFYMKSSQEYSFKLSFSTDISADTPVALNILKRSLYSTTGSKLDGYNFTGSLYAFTLESEAVKAIVINVAAATQAAVSTSIGSAIISNPAAAWALINSIQIVIYLPINSNPLTPGLQAFCTGVGHFNLMPNIMAYVFNKSDTSPPYNEASNFGIDTSVFWVNIGQNTSIFLGLIAIWPFVYLMSKLKVGKIAVKFGNFLHNYKYSVFLRFWIQSYLDVGFFSLVQLKSVSSM